jgi:ribosomal protein S5
MTYIITGDTVGLALGAVSESATDVHEALRKARQMYETGMVNVTIKDEVGHKIDGDDLLACIMGTKSITEDLQAD